MSNLIRAMSFIQIYSKNMSNICIDYSGSDYNNNYKRSDGKSIFQLDEDNYINGKDLYLYSEFNIENKLNKPDYILYMSNNKTLSSKLEKLCLISGFQKYEYSHIVYLWEFWLKNTKTEHFKCEVFINERINKAIPFECSPVPETLNRVLVQFSPTNKIQKDKLNGNIAKPRTGNLRIQEFYGMIIDKPE